MIITMSIRKLCYLFVLTTLTGSKIASAQFPIAESPEEMGAFLNAMPKAELHLHIEGTMPPATLVKLANRNGFDFFNTVGDVTESLATRPPGLDGFLSHHNKMVTVIQTKEDRLCRIHVRPTDPYLAWHLLPGCDYRAR
jgi:hypothetical protein